MAYQKLTPELVEIFIEKLKSGYSWNDGLVGNTTYYYRDGNFVTEGRDMREPESDAYVQIYTEDEFRELLRKRSFVEWSYKGLVKRLET